MNCLKCNKEARWVRSTQFAGDHPYCIEHASREKDFGENDSYTYWYELSNTTGCSNTSTGDEVAYEI